MKLITKDDSFYVLGFDLPAPDRWAIPVTITLDLMHPSFPIETRKVILNQISRDYTKDSFLRNLIDNTLDTKTYNSLIYHRNLHSDAVTITRDGEIWGGQKETNHNIVAKNYPTIEELLKVLPSFDVERNIIEAYVESPRKKDGKLIGGKLIPIEISELTVAMVKKDFFNIFGVYAYTLFDRLDNQMKLHNILVKAKSKDDIPPEFAKDLDVDKISSLIKRGLFPSFFGVEIIPDNNLRKIMWQGMVKVISKDDLISKSLTPEAVKKTRSEAADRSLYSLFTNARSKYQKFFKDLKINQILKSEYYLGEENVYLDADKYPDGLEVLEGGREKIIVKGSAFRPNRRVYGLLESEVNHNRLVKENWIVKDIDGIKHEGSPKGDNDYYFDADSGKIVACVDEFLESVVLDGVPTKIATRLYKLIPPHAIDIYDLKLAEDQERHNKLIEEGERGFISGKEKEIVDFQTDFEKIRPLLDPLRAVDYRFEEILYGIYRELFAILDDYFTDTRTMKYKWKYVPYMDIVKEIKTNLDKNIKIAPYKPANQLALNRIYKMLESSFINDDGQSRFYQIKKGKLNEQVMRIVERLPELAISIMEKYPVRIVSIYEIAKEKSEIPMDEREDLVLPFTESNLESLKNAIPSFIDEYKAMLAAYPYAKFSISEGTDGFFYSLQHTKDVLSKFSLKEEPTNLALDRKELEIMIKFLTIAYEILNYDSRFAEAERKYILAPRKIRTEEEKTEVILKKVKKSREDESKRELTKAQAERINNYLVDIFKKSEESEIKSKIQALADKLTKLHYRWGFPKFDHGVGDIFLYLIDLSTALVDVDPKYKDFKADIEKYCKNIKSEMSPTNMLAMYEVPSKEFADLLAKALYYYYEAESIIFKFEEVDGIKLVSVFQATNDMVLDILENFFDGNLGKMEAFLEKKDLRETELKDEIFSLNFSEEVTETTVRKYLEALLKEEREISSPSTRTAKVETE